MVTCFAAAAGSEKISFNEVLVTTLLLNSAAEAADPHLEDRVWVLFLTKGSEAWVDVFPNSCLII